MKRIALLFFAFLALPYFARAQTAQLYYAFTAAATGGVADTSLAPQVDALNVRISGINTTTSWTAQIQTSPDNATWTNCGSAVTATSAASASGGACTPSGAAFTRVLITAGSGGGNVVGALIGTCSLCQVASSGGITLTTTGTSGPATLVGSVLNIPQYSGSSLPTATAAGQIPAATGAGTTYNAINISKVPVEFYGATPYTSEAAAEAGPDDTAHFQSAVTAAVNGVATCQAGMWYHVEGPVNFASNEGLIGTANMTYGGQCSLVSNSATTHILSAVGTSGTYVTSVTLANLNIARSVAGTGTSAGVYASFTGGVIVTNVRSIDSIYDFYRHASPGDGSGYWSYNVAGWVLAESSGTYYGFYDDSADGNAENSIILTDSAVACQNFTGSAISYGQILTGTAVNDNRTDDFNTAGCTYGQVVNYTGSGASVSGQDIHFIGSTHDTVGTAFEISNLPQSSRATVTIEDAWMSGVAGSTALVDCETSYGLIVSNSMILGPNGSAVWLNSCDSAIVSGNTISTVGGSGYSQNTIVLKGATHSTVANNKVYAVSGTVGNIIYLTSNSTYNSIVGNNLSGYSSAGNGIGIDAGSNYNVDTPNSIDTTHITSGVPIGDSGTGNGVGNVTATTVTASPTSNPSSGGIITAKSTGLGTPQNFNDFFAYGPVDYVGANLATPTVYYSLGFGLSGGTPGTNFVLGLYSSSWQAGLTMNPSTLAATFGGAINPPAARKGTFVCTNGGSIVVSNANYITTSDVVITMNTPGGTITTPPAFKTTSTGVSFTMLCGATDTSTYNYDILN